MLVSSFTHTLSIRFSLELTHCVMSCIGRHDCVSLINNFISSEDLEYYTKLQGKIAHLLHFATVSTVVPEFSIHPPLPSTLHPPPSPFSQSGISFHDPSPFSQSGISFHDPSPFSQSGISFHDPSPPQKFHFHGDSFLSPTPWDILDPLEMTH